MNPQAQAFRLAEPIARNDDSRAFKTLFTARTATEISAIVINNDTTSTATVTLRHVPKGSTGGTKHTVLRATITPSMTALELQPPALSYGLTLETGDFLEFSADQNDVYVSMYGITENIAPEAV